MGKEKRSTRDPQCGGLAGELRPNLDALRAMPVLGLDRAVERTSVASGLTAVVCLVPSAHAARGDWCVVLRFYLSLHLAMLPGGLAVHAGNPSMQCERCCCSCPIISRDEIKTLSPSLETTLAFSRFHELVSLRRGIVMMTSPASISTENPPSPRPLGPQDRARPTGRRVRRGTQRGGRERAGRGSGLRAFDVVHARLRRGWDCRRGCPGGGEDVQRESAR